MYKQIINNVTWLITILTRTSHELSHLATNYMHNEIHIAVKVRAYIRDAPARSAATSSKGHNAWSDWTICIVECELKKKSNGLSKSHFEQGMIIITIDTLPPLNILDCIWWKLFLLTIFIRFAWTYVDMWWHSLVDAC